MRKQTENYIGSQQHWEDRINDDYDYLKQMEKKMEKDVEKLIYNRLEKRNKIILTPKQKAKELVDRFYQTTPNETWITEPSGEFIKTYTAWGHAKQCALIAVDEMLNVLFDDDSNELFHHGTYKLYDYYLEVEEELEKL